MRPALLLFLLFSIIGGYHASAADMHAGVPLFQNAGKQVLVSPEATRNFSLSISLNPVTTAEYLTAEEIADEEDTDTGSSKNGKLLAKSAMAIAHAITLGRLHNGLLTNEPSGLISPRKYILQKTLRI